MTIGSRMSYDASYVKARKKLGAWELLLLRNRKHLSVHYRVKDACRRLLSTKEVAAKQLKNSNAQQLEIETLKMEERIRALKEQMFKEKEEREKQGGIRWASGKSGPLNSHAQDVLKKKNAKTDKTPKKIKILGDEPLHSYKKKVTPRVQPQDNLATSGCGQCERTKATLVCIECEEKYCVSCFMSFHQKGALTKHTTQSIEQYEAELQMGRDGGYKKQEISPSISTARFSSSDQVRFSQMSDSRGMGGGALLQGSYNEEESAQSFAQALMEWRNSGKEEKMQKNPTNAKSSSCETGTTPEPPRHQEVKVNFGPNKSLSYFDRMLLKKHQGDQTFGGPQASFNGMKSNSSELSLNSNSDSNESPKSENQLGMNYREIFQSLGASDKKTSQENFQMPPRSVISIEEVNDADLSGDETTACIVEEGDIHPYPQSRPLSHAGRVSVMCMTPTGRFEVHTDALVLEDVSPVSAPSPSLMQATPRSKQIARGTSSRLGLHLGTKSRLNGSVGRVWSPQPYHVGLSEFFLAGVRGESSSGRTSRERKTIFDPALVKPEKLSKTLLSQHVWKPRESVFSSNDSDTSNEQQQQLEKDDDNKARTDSPRPIIPLLRAPELLDTRNDRPDSQSSTIVPPAANESEFTNDAKIHDFGIVDFLRAPPCLPKGFEDYGQVHRVSTVSPLTLSPNPPSFHWSDDSDDDFLAQVCFQGNQDDQRADQDEDDRATLTDLAWELASTTGRLTQCDLDDEEGEGEEEFDEDSIESNDLGSGLSSSEEDNTAADIHSANVDNVKSKDDSTRAEEEVHALE